MWIHNQATPESNESKVLWINLFTPEWIKFNQNVELKFNQNDLLYLRKIWFIWWAERLFTKQDSNVIGSDQIIWLTMLISNT